MTVWVDEDFEHVTNWFDDEELIEYVKKAWDVDESMLLWKRLASLGLTKHQVAGALLASLETCPSCHNEDRMSCRCWDDS